MGPAVQRFSEWASASRTFSAITDLIAVVQREIDRLCSIICSYMHAPPPPACLIRFDFDAARFSPSRHHHQTYRWRAWSPYDTAASRSQSRAVCLTVPAPVIALSLGQDQNPKPMLMLRESQSFRRAYHLHEQCSGESEAVNVFLNDVRGSCVYCPGY